MRQDNKKPKTDTENVAANAAAQTPEPAEDTAAEPDILTQTEKKLDELNDKYLRLAAEYDNYRKRTQTEKEGIYTDALCTAVMYFLPAFDNLDRALAYEGAGGLKEGLEMVMKQVKDIYEKIGVAEIPAQGEPFDPHLHDAVLHSVDESKGPGEITEVLQKGYTLKGRVIRHSMVKVAN